MGKPRPRCANEGRPRGQIRKAQLTRVAQASTAPHEGRPTQLCVPAYEMKRSAGPARQEGADCSKKRLRAMCTCECNPRRVVHAAANKNTFNTITLKWAITFRHRVLLRVLHNRHCVLAFVVARVARLTVGNHVFPRCVAATEAGAAVPLAEGSEPGCSVRRLCCAGRVAPAPRRVCSGWWALPWNMRATRGLSCMLCTRLSCVVTPPRRMPVRAPDTPYFPHPLVARGVQRLHRQGRAGLCTSKLADQDRDAAH